MQLSFDGGEIEETAVVRRHAHLTDVQKAILRLARERGKVSPLEAGRLVHGARYGICARKLREDGRCCPWASSDGVDALKRLQARGFLEHTARGVWKPPHAA